MIIYVNGYYRPGEWRVSDKFKTMEERLPVFENFIYADINYNGASPYKVVERLKSLADNKKKNDNLMFVGSSLGGFFAYVMTYVFNTKGVILNPAMNPSVSLKKYGFSDDILSDYSKLEKYIGKFVGGNIVSYVCNDDDVIDPRYLINNFNSPYTRAINVLGGGGHRMDNFDDIVDDIIGFYNTNKVRIV